MIKFLVQIALIIGTIHFVRAEFNPAASSEDILKSAEHVRQFGSVPESEFRRWVNANLDTKPRRNDVSDAAKEIIKRHVDADSVSDKLSQQSRTQDLLENFRNGSNHNN